MTPPPTPFVDTAPGSPFAGRETDEILQVTMKDGTVAIGKYWMLGGMHLLQQPDPTSFMGATNFGPMKPEDVGEVLVLKDKARVREEHHERTRGERFPGPEPKTRDDLRYRLEILARAVIKETDWRRRYQLEMQFHDCADRVEMARSKRAWVMAEAKWYLNHNRPPEMADLWCADVASPSLFQKPRDQDFDPDPTQRRKRVPYPADVAIDPLSVPNVMKALKRLGCAAYISLAAEQVYDKARICINFHEVPGRAKVYLYAKRGGGATTWTVRFDCGNSRAAHQRENRIKQLALYRLVIDVVRGGFPATNGQS